MSDNSVLSLHLDNWVVSRLAEPFPPDEVKFRVGGGSTILAYIDARQVVERLNEVVGAANWSDVYHPTTVTETEVKDVTSYAAVGIKAQEQGLNDEEVFWRKNGKITGLKDKSFAEYEYHDIRYGGVQCDLTVLGITKSDVGSPSMAEQLKGATSDALKRAAVKFGIGMYLYDLKDLRGGRTNYGRVVEPPELPDWALPVDRPSPDPVIEETIKKARESSVYSTHKAYIEDVIDEVTVMGSYNPASPLIVKRAVYEALTAIMKEGK